MSTRVCHTTHIVGPCHGSLHRNDDGSYTYVPQDEWFGDDSFSYYVNDSEAKSNVAIVHIKVVPVPTAQNAQFRVDGDGSVRIDLRCLVDDPNESAEAALSISVNAPSHGQLTRKGDGVYVYTPNSNFTGIDAFTYTVTDGTYSATATITLNVRQDDECGDGWNSCTIFVSSMNDDGDDDDQSGGYIIINRRHHKGDDAQPTPKVDWNGTDADGVCNIGTFDNGRWHTLLEQPILGMNDLGKQSGLVVKRES